MSGGFIDPDAGLRSRIERLEILVSALAAHPHPEFGSMEALCALSIKVDADEAIRLRQHRLLKSLGYDPEPGHGEGGGDRG